jgi:hypothetical protein
MIDLPEELASLPRTRPWGQAPFDDPKACPLIQRGVDFEKRATAQDHAAGIKQLLTVLRGTRPCFVRVTPSRVDVWADPA